MRTPYKFNNFSFPVNPADDTGWNQELSYSEQIPIGASHSTTQIGGMKAATRQIGGHIWGPDAMQQYSTMQSWLRNKTQANFTDYLGVTRKAMMLKFDAKIVNDIAAYKNNRATWTYTAIFVALD